MAESEICTFYASIYQCGGRTPAAQIDNTTQSVFIKQTPHVAGLLGYSQLESVFYASDKKV
jgi:hypothetical protein